MKKVYVFSLSACLLLSSCASYMGMGAYTGSQIGSILGSAIGGISNGPRGSDIGTIIGMAGGAAVGAAIGSAIEQSNRQRYEGYYNNRERSEEVRQNRSQRSRNYRERQNDEVDDRIEFTPGDGSYSSRPDNFAANKVPLEVSRVRFTDQNGDGVLKSNEQGKISFEIRNNSSNFVYDVEPLVKEVTGARGVVVSPSIEVESIAPHSGIKYTATVLSVKKLKGDELQFEISAVHGQDDLSSKVMTLSVPTMR